MILCLNLFFKLSKIEDFKVYFKIENHNCPQTKTPHNFHLINKNRMIQSFPCLYKSKKINFKFLFQKKMIFLIFLNCFGKKKNYISYNKFLTIYSKIIKVIGN